jgi:catechol 2,3-dioxygenase-like lactoylglutathione lyase family enzyme
MKSQTSNKAIITNSVKSINMQPMLRNKILLSIITLTLIAGSGIAIAQDTPPPTPLPTPTSLMFRPNHIALRVTDLEESVQWWKSVFGAVEVRRSQVTNIVEGVEIAFLHIADGFHIELIGGGSPEVLEPPKDIAADYGVTGYKHIGFMVADLDRTIEHLAQNGIQPEYETERADYGVRIVLFRDPNGYYIELYEPISQSAK